MEVCQFSFCNDDMNKVHATSGKTKLPTKPKPTYFEYEGNEPQLSEDVIKRVKKLYQKNQKRNKEKRKKKRVKNYHCDPVYKYYRALYQEEYKNTKPLTPSILYELTNQVSLSPEIQKYIDESISRKMKKHMKVIIPSVSVQSMHESCNAGDELIRGNNIETLNTGEYPSPNEEQGMQRKKERFEERTEKHSSQHHADNDSPDDPIQTNGFTKHSACRDDQTITNIQKEIPHRRHEDSIQPKDGHEETMSNQPIDDVPEITKEVNDDESNDDQSIQSDGVSTRNRQSDQASNQISDQASNQSKQSDQASNQSKQSDQASNQNKQSDQASNQSKQSDQASNQNSPLTPRIHFPDIPLSEPTIHAIEIPETYNAEIQSAQSHLQDLFLNFPTDDELKSHFEFEKVELNSKNHDLVQLLEETEALLNRIDHENSLLTSTIEELSPIVQQRFQSHPKEVTGLHLNFENEKNDLESLHSEGGESTISEVEKVELSVDFESVMEIEGEISDHEI